MKRETKDNIAGFFDAIQLINIIFGLASLLGLAFSIYSVVVALSPNAADSSYKATLLALGVCLSVVCICFIGVVFVILKKEAIYQKQFNNYRCLSRDYIQAQNSLNRAASISHNIVHYLRNLYVYSGKVAKLNGLSLKQEDAKEYLLDANKHVLMYLTNIKSAIDSVTGLDNSVSLKLYNKASGEIKTFYRDSNSNRIRKQADLDATGKKIRYSYLENTAFSEILHSRNNRYFVCDDLTSLSTYKNLNPNFKTSYNATLVLPIQGKCSSDSTFHVHGFLCIDNFGGRLNNEFVINFSSCMADLLHISFLQLEKVLTKHKDNAGVKSNEFAKEFLWA